MKSITLTSRLENSVGGVDDKQHVWGWRMMDEGGVGSSSGGQVPAVVSSCVQGLAVATSLNLVAVKLPSKPGSTSWSLQTTNWLLKKKIQSTGIFYNQESSLITILVCDTELVAISVHNPSSPLATLAVEVNVR